jgi:hypothetical protein
MVSPASLHNRETGFFHAKNSRKIFSFRLLQPASLAEEYGSKILAKNFQREEAPDGLISEGSRRPALTSFSP